MQPALSEMEVPQMVQMVKHRRRLPAPPARTEIEVEIDITTPSSSPTAVEQIMEKTTPEAIACLVLCSTFLGTAIYRSSNEDIGAMLIMSAILGLRLDQLNSLHLVAISLIGLILTTFSPQQLFFMSILGLAGYVAVAREGLLYYVPRETIDYFINASLFDLLEAPFASHKEEETEPQAESNSLGPFAALTRAGKLLTKHGVLFASLPEQVRWALLPEDMRAKYEEETRRQILQKAQDEMNQPGIVKQTVNKAIEKVEDSVTDVLSKDVAWLTQKVTTLEDFIAHHPVIWWTEKITFETKKKFGENPLKTGFGALVVTAVLLIAAGQGLSMRPSFSVPGFSTPYRIRADAALKPEVR